MSSVSHTQSIMLGNTLNLVSYTHHVFSQSSCSAVVEDKNWHSNVTSFQNQIWSKWEVLNQVMEFFGDVEPFLKEKDNLSVLRKILISLRIII